MYETERAGFEPAVGFDPYAALAKRCRETGREVDSKTCGERGEPLAPPLALHRPEDPDLARVLAAWDDLPPSIRRAILALVDAR
jgi:hypothetical protein